MAPAHPLPPAAVLAAALLLALLGALAAAAPARAFPTNVAHRGGAVVAPENTLATYDRSLDAGADWLELDVWLSADGVAVCHHDETLDRTTDGSGPIADKTWAELATLDAGSWFGPEFAGEPIPTLAEALVLIQGRGKVILDVKQATAIPALAAVVDAVGFPHEDLRIWLRFSIDHMADDFDAYFPAGQLFRGSGGRFSTFEEDIASWAARGYTGVIAKLLKVDADFIALVRSYGLLLFVDGVNSPLFDTALDLGVDGLVVSGPERLAALLPLPDPACSNGLDDDGDGDVDHPDDAGCFGPQDDAEGAECSDGIDNDGDGAIDHPDDPGCFAPFSETESPACDDGVDDNGDGRADHPADTGCFARYDQREGLACGDGLDNDADGLVDLDDPHCTDLLDRTETPDCGDGLDNDADGLVDLDDPHCADLMDLDEAAPCPPASGGDADGDAVGGDCDNCLLTANPLQVDVDADGFGNRCDADLNQDGIVGVPDFSIFRQCFGVYASAGPPCDGADFTADGVVGIPDFGYFFEAFGSPPGP